jgi:alpha-beta hydrolase superfamily lysophospholipase
LAEVSFYLDAAGEATFTTYHPPVSRAESRAAILILPPFGWEELATHRARRAWALHLSARGHPVARLDLPGSGDSAGSPLDPERWTHWLAAVEVVANWLRAESRPPRVAAIGISMSGYLAYAAAVEGIVDDIALWATPSKGRRLLRELSAFAALETTSLIAPGPTQSMPQGIEAGGFIVAAELADRLRRIDLITWRLPAATRVLLLDRDQISGDDELEQTLRGSGLSVTVAPGRGFGAMLTPPDQSRPPVEVFATFDRWIADQPAAAGSTAHKVSRPDAKIEVELEGVRERPISIASTFGEMRAVIAEPLRGRTSSASLVFLNAGAIRRTGPNRMWVDAARRWAGRGIASARIDLEGIGDADGGEEIYQDVARFHDERLLRHVDVALDELQRSGLSAPFVLIGLCSGGYWAFQTTLTDQRVASAIMINPRALFWHKHLDAIRDLRRTRLLKRAVTWRRLVKGDVSLRRWAAVIRWLASVARRPLRGGTTADASVLRWQTEHVSEAFARLHERDRRARFIFCDGEPLRDELTDDGLLTDRKRWPNVSVTIIPGRDHTLRPLWMRPHAEAALDDAISAEVDAARETR